MKKIIAMILVAMLAFAGVSAMAESLKMCTNVAFPPYEFYGEDGEPTGIDVEIAKAIWRSWTSNSPSASPVCSPASTTSPRRA